MFHAHNGTLKTLFSVFPVSLNRIMNSCHSAKFRRTTQDLLPRHPSATEPTSYDLYPVFPVDPGSIACGFEEIAERIIGCRRVRIDGYVGVSWTLFQQALERVYADRGIETEWIDASEALKNRDDLAELTKPFLGGDDPLFGTRCDLLLADFFDKRRLESIRPADEVDCTILFGCGAGLVDWDGPLVYVDVPKNEIQYRSRAGSICNLATNSPASPKQQYKQFYFVDWPVLNRHKAELVHRVDWFVDGQRPDDPAIVSGEELRQALGRMSRNVFRVRPWFEPGPWGGQRIKQLVPQLPQDVPNYAWSFELIAPENGLLLSDGNHLLEVSFDWLMYHNAKEILGECFGRFGSEFPIRFDFLDTFDGGNLSVQCHPQTEYIRKQFGESFTQDETYYILDCKPDAQVYLGFVEDIDRGEFLNALKTSQAQKTQLDVEQYVNVEPVQKHDLLLIPNGTIHCSGINNLVLEISATPYIFTFKMYDWQRMDLDGRPRPLNIQRAFDNLRFDRNGSRMAEQFVSQPVEIESGADWRTVHLPTHREHFYDVHRFEFDNDVTACTGGTPHVMMLVEGTSLIVETAQGMRQRFHYAETFVIPSAAESYRLINEGPNRAFVINAFVKSPSTS